MMLVQKNCSLSHFTQKIYTKTRINHKNQILIVTSPLFVSETFTFSCIGPKPFFGDDVVCCCRNGSKSNAINHDNTQFRYRFTSIEAF